MKPRGSIEIQKSKCPSTKALHNGLFTGLYAVFVELGVSRKRLQVWQKRFVDLGGTVLTSKPDELFKNRQIIVLAAHRTAVLKGLDCQRLRCSMKLNFVQFKWVEECLQNGRLLPYEPYSILTTQDHCLTTDDEKVSAQSRLQLDHCTTAPALVNNATNEDSVHDTTNEEVTGECVHDTELSAIWDDTPYFNKDVSGPLLELSEIYSNVFADEWRALTYRKVANKLDKLPYKISDAHELTNIQGIGKSMINKIKEILSTGQLQKLVNLKANKQVQTMQLFASVWGIGPKLARRLYGAGHRSLFDLLGDNTLPSMARVGLKYHQDISLRIPHAEVAAAGAFVREVIKTLCPGALITVGGSYRRGQATCGDIDLLITHPDGHSHSGLMGRLVSRLQELEFLVPCSSPSIESNTNKVVTFMGICKHPQYSHHRRIDIKVYPKDAFAFALVYFTGNDVLNRRIRYLAKTKGYKLSDQGLYPRLGVDGQTSDISIPCETEEEIFEKLGLAYPEPHERNW